MQWILSQRARGRRVVGGGGESDRVSTRGVRLREVHPPSHETDAGTSRRLAAADPGVHRALSEAAAQAIARDAKVFTAVVAEVLDQAGGPLRDGYAVR